MEPYRSDLTDRIIRLKSYARAGFLKVNPGVVDYHQPDFRSPQEIDASGGPRPVQLQLVIRRVGLEKEQTLSGAEVKSLVAALYQMYATEFRPQDMAVIWDQLKTKYPSDESPVQLVDPQSGPKKLRAYYHPGYVAPIGNHIMPMHKFGLVADGLAEFPGVQLVKPEPVTEEDLLRVHTPEYIEAVKSGEPRTLAESQKFPWSPLLYPSVLLTNGGLLAAAKDALKTGASAAIVSGFHHSHSERGEGFCTFNGLIVALEVLKSQGLIRSAAILDMDLHYGNGTALLAETRPWVKALSIYGNDYWNNTAYKDVTIKKHQDGANHRSATLPAGCDGATQLQIMEAEISWLIAGEKPDILLYQAGADPYLEDPYSPLALDQADLQARDRFVFQFALKNKIPIAWVLAGGYTADISKVVQVHVNTFRAWSEVYHGQQG